jgi:hypothetical protein
MEKKEFVKQVKGLGLDISDDMCLKDMGDEEVVFFGHMDPKTTKGITRMLYSKMSTDIRYADTLLGLMNMGVCETDCVFVNKKTWKACKRMCIIVGQKVFTNVYRLTLYEKRTIRVRSKNFRFRRHGTFIEIWGNSVEKKHKNLVRFGVINMLV